MARPVPMHKKNFDHFIQPNYAHVSEVSAEQIAKSFNDFLQERIAEIPDEGEPKDPYMYNAHMGQCVRAFDEAKDHFIKAKLAFYAKRGSANAAPQ